MKRIFLILYHYAKTKFAPWKSHEKFFKYWQERRVRQHVRWVRRHSKFYAELWRGRDNRDWRKFPQIDKEIMMENLNTLNTRGVDRDEALSVALKSESEREFSPTLKGVTVGLSSGTSGNRGLFLVDPNEEAQWVGTILAKTLPGGLLRGHRIGLFLRANSNMYSKLGSGRIAFQYFDLMQPLKVHLEQLKKFQPSVLVAPPSLLLMLVEEMRQGSLKIKPEKVFSVAEVLEPLDRLLIEKTFQIPIDEIYQCTEGFLGVSCQYGTIHLNEDLVFVEKDYIDREARRFCPIITDFTRRTQPIVRYRLNDILRERETPCPCGAKFQGLERIEGRCDDILYFYDEKGEEPRALFPDFIRRGIISSSDKIQEYRAVQERTHHLKLSLKLDEKDREEVEGQVEKNLKKLFESFHLMPLDFEFESDFKLNPGQKLRRIENRKTQREKDASL